LCGRTGSLNAKRLDIKATVNSILENRKAHERDSLIVVLPQIRSRVETLARRWFRRWCRRSDVCTLGARDRADFAPSKVSRRLSQDGADLGLSMLID
jgi:hypothetical protein